MSTYNNLPDYETLFGALDFKEGDEARSVYSPAAYLADLLQMMDDEFTSTDDVKSRRSDIRQILLDSENTYEEIPYLEIVNEVLESKVDGEVYDEVLKEAKYPFNAPFNLSQEEVKLYLKYLGITQEELHKIFVVDQNDTLISREYLNLVEQEYDLVIKQDNDNDEIEEYYGYSGTNFQSDMANVTTFLETTDLTGVETREFLFQSLREEEYGFQTNFFINYKLDNDGGYATLDDAEENIIWSNNNFVTDETKTGTLPYAWFDRVNRFVRLAKKANISFTDLDLILRHCCDTNIDEDAVQMIATVKKAKELLDLPYDEVVALLTSINEVGQTEENEPADLFNRLFNNRYVEFDSRYILGSSDPAEEFVDEEYTELEYFDDLFSDDNYDFRKRIRYVFSISSTDLEKIIQRLDDHEISDDLWMLKENKVSLLNFLYRFTKLASALDISHEELFTLFNVLEKDPTIAGTNQRNIFLSYLPSQQDCYDIFLGSDVKDMQWLLQTLHWVVKWMNAHEFSADILWSITTGKFKTEEAEETVKKQKIAVLNTLYQGFRPLMLDAELFYTDPFTERDSEVIYRSLRTMNKYSKNPKDIRLVNVTDQEAIDAFARKAVDQLSWITKHDFMGLGIEEKLSQKIFDNLVFRGYINEQGVILPDNLPTEKEEFRLETDFSDYRDKLFHLIHELYTNADEEAGEETEEIEFMLYPSDLKDLDLEENELNEIYDNLIFNNYIDDEGNVQHPYFFSEEKNSKDFDINTEINEEAEEVYEMFQKHLKMFNEGRLVLNKNIFGELPLDNIERGDLLENLKFNNYVDEDFVVQDKNRILGENPETFALALQFYPQRHSIFELVKGAVQAHQYEYMAFDIDDLAESADRIVANWAYQDLQGEFINGVKLLPTARAFFMDEENAKNFVLSYYFDNQPGNAVFNRVAEIIKSSESFRLIPQSFEPLKFSESETEEVFEVLEEMEALTKSHSIPTESLDYYLDSNNALSFSVENFEDFNKDIFFLLQAVAKNVKAAEDAIKLVFAETAKKQDHYLFSQLQTIFGLDADTMRSISKEMFLGVKDLKSAWLQPIMATADALDNISSEPKDQAFNTVFNRIRQFAQLATKLQLSKEEVELAFRDQNIVAKFPEKLELDGIDSFDAILESNDFVYLFADGQYWTYRQSDYELIDKMDLYEKSDWTDTEQDIVDLQRDDDDLREVLEEDSIRLLFEKEEGIDVTAAFKDKEGNTYILSGDHYFLLPKDSDTWDKRDNEFGNVDNNFETLTDVDAAFKDEEGRLFLFSNHEYVRYSDDYDYIDEGYPKKIDENWKAENLKLELPERFHCSPGAGFEGTDGNTYFFHKHDFVSSEKPEEVMSVAEHWGKLEHSFKDIDKIDAAFTDGADTYFFAGKNVVKYTDCIENEGIQVAEGFPMHIMDLYPSLPHEFSRGVDAAFKGEDGKIHLFKDEYSVSFTTGESEINIAELADVWGKVRNNIQENGTVDAVLNALDGKTYVFSGDQYFRYSTADYSKVDSGYPRLVSEDFEGLMQVEAAFVLDGKTYLFGVSDAEEQVYVRYSTSDYTEVDEEDEDEATYVTPVENLPDVEEVETFPRPQDDEFWSLPTSLIDAGFTNVDAVFNGLDGKTYLFADEYVVEFEQAKRWWSEPEKISEKWENIGFTSVTAAFAGKDGKTYLFSGDEYVRISDSEFCKVDNGYPRSISKYWGEVENNINKYHRVDAAFVVESREDEEDDQGDDIEEINMHTYLFAGDQFFRYVGDDYSEVEAGYPRKLEELKEEPRFEELKVTLEDGIDAAIADNRNVYLFQGQDCHVIADEEHWEYDGDNYSGISTVVQEYGTTYTLESGTWKRMSSLEGTEISKVEETPNFLNDAPDNFKTSADAILRGTDGNTYLFNGTECYNSLMKLSYDTGDEWGRARNNIYLNETIDAAFVGRDGKTYVFSGDQYFVYEADTYVGKSTQDPPQSISEKFGLDSVMLAYVKDDLTYLFEKPDAEGYFRYVVYSNDTYERSNKGYPRRTDIGFFGVPSAQQRDGFDRFDTILKHGDNMIFIKDQDFIRYNTLEENWSYPKPLDLIYKDIPFNKTTFQDIKTAFVGADDTVYFFNEDCYTAYSNGTFTDVKEIKDDWGLVQNNFESSVDAAFVHMGQTTYLFSGNKYVRYSTSDYRFVDEGYPKEIAKDLRTEEPFKFMPKEFQYAIDEIEESMGEASITGVVSNARNTYVFLNGTLYVGSKNQYDTLMMANIGKIRNNFQEEGVIDASFVDNNGKTYLFSGDQYIRYSDDRYDFVDEGYPKSIVDDLAGELGIDSVPADYHYGIDAAFTDEEGVVYLFRDEHYLTSSTGTEQEITENWGKVKNCFLENVEDRSVDAAYIDDEGRLFVFKGDQFIRYTDPKELFTEEDPGEELQKYVDADYPMLIEDHPAMLPASFQSDLGSAFRFEGRLYFVKDTEYVMAIDDHHSCDDSIYPQKFTYRWGEWSDYLISDIHILSRFKKLQDTFSTEDYSLTNLLHGGAGKTKEPYLAVAEMFEFDKEEVRWMKQHNAFVQSINQFETDFSIEQIVKLYDVMRKAQEMNVDVSKLYEDVWVHIYGDTQNLATAAANIYEMLGTIEYNDNYKALIDEIEGALHTLKRDALVPYLISIDPDVDDARDLYEKLLIDVKMESGATTSRIVEATQAIQLFFHRYFINLEEVDLRGSNDEEVKETLKTQWEWMRNYRVWEANRKVFLYPENYIRPELRDSKTPPFETLEQDLLQGEITEDAAERVYKKYLDEYTEVSRLKIAGGYVYDEPGSSGTDKNLVLFGRTKTDPMRYYYRFGNFANGESSGATWEAWEKVEVAIEADQVYPVYAFNRVFVFWATTESYIDEEDVESSEVTVIDDEKDTTKQTASSDSNTKYKVKVYYSFYNLNEEWVQPQLLSTAIASTSAITSVDLFAENSEKLGDDEHDNIVITCTYTNDDGKNVVAYHLTPELYSSEESTIPYYENKGETIFSLLFEESTTPDSDDIVMLNTIENNLDGPWFTYEHKGGGFLAKPDVPALSSDLWPQQLSSNSDKLPKNESNITAAFDDGSTRYYFADKQYFSANDIVTSEDGTETYNKTNNKERWGLIENNIQATGEVDASYTDGNYVYVFSGDQVFLYTNEINGDLDAFQVEDGYPQKWTDDSEFPTSWERIDAAFKGADGNVYLFNNTTKKYVIKGNSSNELNIADKWGITVNNFTNSNEAIQVVASFVYDGKIYLFNDDQYIRYSSTDFTSVDDGYPKAGYIADLFRDLGATSDLSDYENKRLDSAYVDGNVLKINYDDESEVSLDLTTKAIEKSTGSEDSAFTYSYSWDWDWHWHIGDGTRKIIFKHKDGDDPKLTVCVYTDYEKVADTYKEHNFYFQDENGNNKMIHSAFVWGDNAYLFSGQEYMVWPISRMFNIDGNTGSYTVDNQLWSATGNIADTFGNGSSNFDNSKIDAAYVSGNYSYLISGDSYVRYTGTDYDQTTNFTDLTKNLIDSYPEGWNQIDAVIPATDNSIHYLINNTNKQFVKIKSNAVVTGEKNTVDYWGLLNTNNFAEDGSIHAAFVRGSEVFLFSGTQFTKHTIETEEDGVTKKVSEYAVNAYYPKTIGDGITEVSAAFMLNDYAYIIVGDSYYKLSSDNEPDDLGGSNNATTGAILTSQYIKGNWGNFPGDLRTDMSAALVSEIMDANGNMIPQLYFIKGSEYIGYTLNDDDEPVPYEIEDVDYEVIRLTSSTADSLNQALFANGIDGLLSATTQQIDEVPSFSKTTSSATSIKVTDKVPNPPVNTHLDFNSANGIYYWEVFFHAPFHIAMSLNADQKFEYAKEWYEYIYDPTQVSNYWKFLPFLAVDIEGMLNSMEGSLEYFKTDDSKTVSEEFSTYSNFANELEEYKDAFLGYQSLTDAEKTTLSEIETWTTYKNFSDTISGLETTDLEDSDNQTKLENAKTNLEEVLAICTKLYYRYTLITNTSSQLDTYLDDPFDPHAIAELRKIAYRKTIVMNYIDNLLDWGDMLFRQYSRESINEARMLYVLAYDLLGKKPENLGEKVLTDERSYDELKHYYDGTDFNYDFLLLELENLEDPEVISSSYDSLSFTGTVHDSIANPYFFIPENSQFIEYWDRVEDRLYKIRHSLNIMGEKQPLALFQPEIDPMALVNAIAGGGSLSAALGDLNIAVPHYRFDYMLGKAKEYAQKVEQFGGDLLAAIEKKDAEELNILYNKQETSILNLTTQLKEKQIEDSEINIKSLEESLKSTEKQRDHYKNLISDGLISEEETQINMMIAAASVHGAVVLAKIISGLSYVIPQTTLGAFSFGVTMGGEQFGAMLDKFGESTESIAEGLSLGGEVAGIYAQHKRSVEDWTLQQQMAEGEIEQIKYQIASAKIQKAIAQRDLQIHKKTIENNESVATFMKEKFSNKDLYQWMSGKLSSMFYQSYKLAHDMAKQAEKAFQFETGTKEAEVSYINGMYWDSQKKGLLSGESLSVDIIRMEKAFIEQDQRTMEVTKNISLLELDPLAFIELKTKGSCMFRFTEAMFAYDFPGHFKRQVKTISIAFDIGEGQYVNATLTQLNNKVIVEDDIKAVKYLLNPKGSEPSTIRSDWKPQQQVALSYVDQYTENNGLFELRYYDDRYLPFEGTGAISLWKLELNGGSYNPNDLLDVTIKLRYSANQGGSVFASAVKGALKPYNTTSFFDIAFNFPTEWNTFMNNDERDLNLTFTKDMFPKMSGGKIMALFLRYEYNGDKKATFELNDEVKLTDSKYIETSNLNVTKDGTDWKFTIKGDKASIKNVELITVYKAKP